jgi:TonB-dependent SusC/RagA subfamily outer membrane receptor
MRIISTLFLLFIVSCCFGQSVPETGFNLTCRISGLPIAEAKRDTLIQPVQISLRCSGTINRATEPLLVVDGVPLELKNFSQINPTNIESITILKTDLAPALYGCVAARGVIIITTKSGKLKKFIIKDFFDGKPVVGATVKFQNTKTGDSIFAVANDSGVVVTDKIGFISNYRITVSAIGYKTLDNQLLSQYNKEGEELLLERRATICDEVVISSIECRRRIRCTSRCWVTKGAETVSIKKSSAQTELKIFPNPAQRGQQFNFQLKDAKPGKILVRVLSMQGNLVLSLPVENTGKSTTIRLSANLNWAAGIYFIQAIYENGEVAASGKITIQ